LTDPRVAALAKVLRHTLLFHYDDDPTLASEDAAAILAALPADWCAEAVAAERERIEAAIMALDRGACAPRAYDHISRDEVLAIVRGEPTADPLDGLTVVLPAGPVIIDGEEYHL
jgi:hypothetical protein